MSNLVACCHRCNRRKGNKDLDRCGLTLVPLDEHRRRFPLLGEKHPPEKVELIIEIATTAVHRMAAYHDWRR